MYFSVRVAYTPRVLHRHHFFLGGVYVLFCARCIYTTSAASAPLFSGWRICTFLCALHIHHECCIGTTFFWVAYTYFSVRVAYTPRVLHRHHFFLGGVYVLFCARCIY